MSGVPLPDPQVLELLRNALAWVAIALFVGGAGLATTERRHQFAVAIPVALGGAAAVAVWIGVAIWPATVLAVLLVVAGTYADRRGHDGARGMTVVGWIAFAGVCLALIPHYLLYEHNALIAVGAAVAVPAALQIARLLASGRDSLYRLTRAVAVAGLVYLPFAAVPTLQRMLVVTVVGHTELLMGALGFQAPEAFEVVSGAEYGYADYPHTFLFEAPDGHPIAYTIVLACTGIKSMATFAGVVAAVDADLRRKLGALAVSLPVIYGLNLVRNAFIALSFGQQRLQIAPDVVLGLFGAEDPYLVSYLLADRVLAQLLSVVALVAIAWAAIRILPELLDIVDDALYALSGGRVRLQPE